MSEVLLCRVEDTFQITARGLVIAPMFPVSEWRFEPKQAVRIVSPEGDEFECRAVFQIPHQSPPAKILSFCCALLDVDKRQVPIGSQLWLLGQDEAVVRIDRPDTVD